MRVLVLGGSGMLGSMVWQALSKSADLEMAISFRPGNAENLPAGLTRVDLDAAYTPPDGLRSLLNGVDWVVNCIGVIKQQIHDDQPADVERAIRVNALFPHQLARAAREAGARVLQIATDCVYSGAQGLYLESAAHDPLDVYGKTKSLGEMQSLGWHNLRCSIIGPERKEHRSLLDWFLGQPQGARLTGYQNHRWNGVTTLHFARICLGIMRGGVEIPGLVHVIPADIISKAELLRVFAAAFSREDLTIEGKVVSTPIDRSLATSNPDLNRAIWAAAGYDVPPSIETMVHELADFIKCAEGKAK